TFFHFAQKATSSSYHIAFCFARGFSQSSFIAYAATSSNIPKTHFESQDVFSTFRPLFFKNLDQLRQNLNINEQE
ncbi:hypothetical protein ACFLFF_17240, partial [Brevibacillus reuszeri]